MGPVNRGLHAPADMSSQLFFLSLADIFSVYPQIFREIISTEENRRKEEGKLAKDHIYLPSDEEWQHIVYYRLLDVQKKVNVALESGLTLEQITHRTERPVFDPAFVIEKFSPSTTPNGMRFDDRKRCVPDHPIEYIDITEMGSWTLENICKAAKLLKHPPVHVEFVDEHEMRKVYSLIYDVFRYKLVLSKALTDTSFYAHHLDLVGQDNRVWLMLFELFSRHFLKRKSQQIQLQDELYRDADVYHIAECLWKHRVRLAASISRMRIRKGALQLSELLPHHLQNEKVAIAAANPVVSGWINPFILENKTSAETFLTSHGLTAVSTDDNNKDQQLQENQYKWDKMCPLFLSILPQNRSSFAQSEFIRKNFFIMQDRTFAIAPAIVSQLFEHFELEGDIVQTHVSSPRSTAYLASLFRSISRVGEFLAYGCGSMLGEYKSYMKSLGIRNVQLFAEAFTSIPLETPKFNAVVGIFATPPNSFSAVSDPIDLICSRGGDLNMLEVMTESEISCDGRKRVTQILEEQRETLRMAMSRPQVQFVLYQTHSVVDCENMEMVRMAVENVNRNAFEKHLFYYKEKKRLEALAEAEAAAIPMAASMLLPRKRLAGGTSSATTSKTDDSQQAKRRLDSRENSFLSDDTSTADTEDFTQIIHVPKCDQFEIANLPDVCQNQDSCLDMVSMGCYISLIQRKQITRLNAKYLIQMAEGRGLFGKADRDKSGKTRALKKQEKSEAKKPVETKAAKVKKEDEETLLKRIMQPTLASEIRSNLSKMSSAQSRFLKFNNNGRECSRFCFESGYSRARTWWLDSMRFIQRLQRKSRRRRWILDNQYDITKLMKFAVHPLHLPSRDRRPGLPKEPYPMAVTCLDFPPYRGSRALKQESLSVSSILDKPLELRAFQTVLSARRKTRPLGLF